MPPPESSRTNFRTKRQRSLFSCCLVRGARPRQFILLPRPGSEQQMVEVTANVIASRRGASSPRLWRCCRIFHAPEKLSESGYFWGFSALTQTLKLWGCSPRKCLKTQYAYFDLVNFSLVRFSRNTSTYLQPFITSIPVDLVIMDLGVLGSHLVHGTPSGYSKKKNEGRRLKSLNFYSHLDSPESHPKTEKVFRQKKSCLFVHKRHSRPGLAGNKTTDKLEHLNNRRDLVG